MSSHKTSDGILKRVIAQEEELETLYAHLRAIVANPDPGWTGWRHALEMLIPDSEPRLDELQDDLRAKGMGHLADRLAWLRTPENTEDPTDA